MGFNSGFKGLILYHYPVLIDILIPFLVRRARRPESVCFPNPGGASTRTTCPLTRQLSSYGVHVTVHRDKFLIIKPTRCTNYSNLFLEWNSTRFGQLVCPSSGVFHCTHSNGICQAGLLTACEKDQDGTQFHLDPARKLSANQYDIYHCCVYSEKLLMMDRETVRNV